DQYFLPTMKSVMPSPSTSAAVDPCGSVNVTSPAFFVAQVSMIMCWTNEMSPFAARCCSYQARPYPCALSDVTTSLRPSPFTSHTAISAPPLLAREPTDRENATGWYFQSASGAPPGAGCSHQPY